MAGEFSYSLEVSHLPGSYNTGDRDNLEPVAVTWVRGGYLFHKDRSNMPMFEAYIYRAKFVEDFDGAPTAYGWDRPDDPKNPDFYTEGPLYGPGSSLPKYVNLQKNLQPLESRGGQQVGLANAASPWQNLWHGHDFTWVGVVAATPQQALFNNFMIDNRPPLQDRNGKFPIVQPADAPAPGYYVSQNPTIVDSSKPWWDQRRYADGNTFPYIVLPEQFKNHGCRLGDVGIAIRPKTGKSAAFAFGDTGTWGHLGEASSYLYRTVTGTKLGDPPDNADYITFLVLPNSGMGNTQGLHLNHNVEFRTRTNITPIGEDNSYELPLLLALGGDISRFNAARKRIAAGLETPFSTPGWADMLKILVSRGYNNDD
jgi:hypothetical protein